MPPGVIGSFTLGEALGVHVGVPAALAAPARRTQAYCRSVAAAARQHAAQHHGCRLLNTFSSFIYFLFLYIPGYYGLRLPHRADHDALDENCRNGYKTNIGTLETMITAC